MPLQFRLPGGLLRPIHTTPQLQDEQNPLRGDAALFAQRHAKTTLLLGLVAPLVQAAGTATMLAAAKKATSGADASGHVAVFAAASLLLPSVIQHAAKVEQKRWLQAGHATYDDAFLRHDKNRPALWAMDKDKCSQSSSNQRKERTYLFGARLRWGVFNEINIASDASRTALELGVAMALFSATIGLDITVAFAGSAALIGAFGLLAVDKTVARNEALSAAGGALDGHLRRYYDNVELGNENNYQRWRQQLHQLSHEVATLTTERATADALRGLFVLALARAPVMVALTYRLASLPNAEDRSAVGRDIILQLPYLFQMTERLVGFAELMSKQFLPARTALANSLQEARRTPALDLHAHIDGDAIFVAGPRGKESFAHAWPDLLEAAKGHSGGRYTLTGANGKGKSMALLAIKQAPEPHLAMLVPANLRELAFPLRKGSSGERVLDALQAAFDDGPRVLLLDEWEAHLDADNRRSMGDAFDKITAPTSEGGGGRVVIEISHQQR